MPRPPAAPCAPSATRRSSPCTLAGGPVRFRRPLARWPAKEAGDALARRAVRDARARPGQRPGPVRPATIGSVWRSLLSVHPTSPVPRSAAAGPGAPIIRDIQQPRSGAVGLLDGRAGPERQGGKGPRGRGNAQARARALISECSEGACSLCRGDEEGAAGWRSESGPTSPWPPGPEIPLRSKVGYVGCGAHSRRDGGALITLCVGPRFRNHYPQHIPLSGQDEVDAGLVASSDLLKTRLIPCVLL